MKFIFVGGSPRSGTTLVQKVLIIHSKIAGTGEFEYLEQMMKLYATMNESIISNNNNKNFYDQSKLKEYWKGFLENLFSNIYNKKKDAIYFSEKSPNNIYVAKTSLDLIPDSKFIFVYRDGRDVVNSFKQVNIRYKRENKKSPMRLITLVKSMGWVNGFNIYDDLKNDPQYENRIYGIKYEELVNQPLAELEKLMTFIGLDLEKEQLDPSVFDFDSNIKNIDNTWYDEKMHNQKINSNNIGKWKNELSFIDKFIVNIILAKRLKMEGYQVNSTYIKFNKLFFSFLDFTKLNYKKWR